MSRCKYETQRHGFLYPSSASINGISLYNVEPHCTDLVNILIIKKVLKDKKKQKQMEDSFDHSCDK